MKKMNKLLSLILVLAIALSLAIPAMAAAPEYSVTIVPSPSTGVEDHIYEAYQIFSGNLDSTGKKLTEVQWAVGVNKDNLLTALAADANWTGKVTAATSAQELADLLADETTTTAMLLAFRVIAGENLATAAASVDAKDADGNYVLDLTATGAGYYLIKDKDGSLTGDRDTYTNYMLRVVGQDELHPKAGTVDVDKVVVDGGSAKKFADYSIGDTVDFRVTGTLPMVYSSYPSFKYEIVDTMSKGLSYVGNVKLYAENSGTREEITNGFTATDVVNADGTTTLTVSFADLKAVTGCTIDSSTNIILEYQAEVNENAIIGGTGNPNVAKIIFTNNPYTFGDGETPEDYAIVFTWRLDVTKTDDLGNGLAEAKFILYREKAGVKQYVVLDADKKVDAWTEDKSLATVMISQADGLMPIIGLEADTYYLEETEAPDGYNILTEPVTIIITATPGADDFIDLEIKIGLAESKDGDLATGVVAGNVVNKSGAVLPETGGIGTTIFYLLGSTLALGAVVLMITKKRMSA